MYIQVKLYICKYMKAFGGPYIYSSSHFDKYIHTLMNMFAVSKALIHETSIYYIYIYMLFFYTVLNVKVTYS